MATIDQQFVEYIVKTLVSNPDKVAIERKIDEKGVLLSLTVDPSDVGRVIGRRGVTAQAIRVLLRALGSKQDARYNLKIVNGDEEEGAVKHEKSEDKEESKDTPEIEDEIEDTSIEPEDESEDEDDDDEDDEEEETSSELAEKTRAELADLDDLDI